MFKPVWTDPDMKLIEIICFFNVNYSSPYWNGLNMFRPQTVAVTPALLALAVLQGRLTLSVSAQRRSVFPIPRLPERTNECPRDLHVFIIELIYIYIYILAGGFHIVLYYQRVRDDDDDDDGFPTVFLSLYAIQSNFLWGYTCRLLFQTGSSQTICQSDNHGFRAKLAIQANFNRIDCFFDLPFYKGGGRCYVCWSLLAYNQWSFQEPKLEVPTIYKAYVRAM